MYIFFDFFPRVAAEIFVRNRGTIELNRENRLFINCDYWQNKLDGKNVQVETIVSAVEYEPIMSLKQSTADSG